jgi:hypothetical protein
VLEDASAVRFNLLDEVLNVTLHYMPVKFDRVKDDLVFAASRFEDVSVHKFSCAIAAYGLGSMPPERGQLVQVLPRVLTCASVDHSTEVRPDIEHHRRISLAVQSQRLLPHDRPVNVPFIARRHSSFEDACRLAVRGAVASGHCGPCLRSMLRSMLVHACAQRLPDGAALDHRELMASWSVHFACVVVYEEASVLELLVCEQDFLRLRKEHPGLRRRRTIARPLSVFSRKARSTYCATWGLSSRPFSFALRGCLRTTCSGLLVTEISACVSGYALQMGFAMKRFARRTVHVRGMREEGGKRETQK